MFDSIETFNVQISVTFVISNYSVLNVDTRKNLELCTAPNLIKVVMWTVDMTQN